MAQLFNDKTEFYNLLRRESMADIDDASIDILLENAILRQYPAKSYILTPGEIDTNLYILKTGINRIAYTIPNSDEEVTMGFAEPTTLLLSPLGWFFGKPAFYYAVACTDCEFVVIKKADVERAMEQSNAVARFLFNIAIGQLVAFELKTQRFESDSKERYKEIISRRDVDTFRQFSLSHPDIINVVPDKVIASYLGLHPVYFSRMKREIFKEEKERLKQERERAERERLEAEAKAQRLRDEGIIE